MLGQRQLLFQRGAVLRLPQRVGRLAVQLAQDMHQFLQDAHGKGAGTAGRVEHAQAFDGLDELLRFLGGEVVAGVAVAEELAQAGC